MLVKAKWEKLGDDWYLTVGTYNLAVVGLDCDRNPYWATAGRLTNPVQKDAPRQTKFVGGGPADSIALAKRAAEIHINGTKPIESMPRKGR